MIAQCTRIAYVVWRGLRLLTKWWKLASAPVSMSKICNRYLAKTVFNLCESAICMYFESAKRIGFEIVAKNWPKMWRNIQIVDYLCNIYKQ